MKIYINCGAVTHVMIIILNKKSKKVVSRKARPHLVQGMLELSRSNLVYNSRTIYEPRDFRPYYV